MSVGLAIIFTPTLPNGDYVCEGEDGCGVNVLNRDKHLAWHQDMAELVDGIAGELENILPGAKRYAAVHPPTPGEPLEG